MSIKRSGIILILILFISYGFVRNNDFEISKNLDIFTSIIKELNTHYVDEIQPGELFKTGIDAMLKSLDPYTVYIPESQIEDYKFMTTGQYGGIGSLIHKRDNFIRISKVYHGFPAHRSGLMAGDKVIEINGQSIQNKKVGDISKLLKGEIGTEVKLLIERYNNSTPFEISVKRETIKIKNIPYYGMVSERIGYIKLNGFTQNAGKEVRDAFVELSEKNDIKGIILDLRGNGGGLLHEAVNITNIFTDKGELIVTTKGKLASKTQSYRTLNEPIDTKMPLAVLIDASSASASEIVSGSIQDLDRGIIIGKKSFGKGLVQNVLSISYQSKLKVTISKYYIPSGRCIQAIDYAEKNSKKLKVDSSIVFKTKNGRNVYDRGGIEPDVSTEDLLLSNISYSLITKYHIDDFATKYRFQNDTIPIIKDFIITDEIFDEFVIFISDKDYDYTTRCERLLEKFEETSKKEKYFSDLENELMTLKNKVIHNKKEDILKFKEEIKSILKVEISGRYYYEKGEIEAAFDNDEETKKAIELLNNLQEYNQILSGK